ncbi:hypothetical protein niasHT_020001 [Heterodera trifolii]|uniref:Membralin n=1 Tax=Heterodera trifolii TaxID=157864 RepID=A0ABD2L726_9BILA
MAANVAELRPNDVSVGERRQQTAQMPHNNQNQQQFVAAANPRFGNFRDRLFQAMLVRLSLPYHQNVPRTVRRFFEFITLFNAFALLAVLIYTHFLLNSFPARCLDSVYSDWPRKGIIRLEVIQNLEEYRERLSRKESELAHSSHCLLDIADILRNGELPAALRSQLGSVSPPSSPPPSSVSPSLKVSNDSKANGNNIQQGRARFGRPLPTLFDLFLWLVDQFNQQQWEFAEGTDGGETAQWADDRAQNEADESSDGEDIHQGQKLKFHSLSNAAPPVYYQLVEFSLHYGLLKLSMEMRQELDVGVQIVQLDPEKAECFRDWRERFLMRYLIEMDELILSSVKHLMENETERGFLRDLIGGELYHFVYAGPSSSSTYLTAAIVMLIFTLAISMLLRFSHDQMFVFIIDLFQMFEQNQPMMFPIAPLLTVILALIGMEAIMSEIFNDTTTAFYVILLVWMADQYDAIFCRSPIGRRHWLRFFYLYHFAFYAYHYRYNGLYGGLALLTSAVFTLHSMIYFYHKYELPYIIYQEQLIEFANHFPNANEVINNTVQGAEAIENAERQQQNDRNGDDDLLHGNGRTFVDGLRRRVFGVSAVAALMRRIGRGQLPGGENAHQNDGEQRTNDNNEQSERRAGERVAEQIMDETMREIAGTLEDEQWQRQNEEANATGS